MLRIVKGGKWIDLSATPAPTTDADPEGAEDADPDQSEDLEPGDEPPKVGADLGGDNLPAPPAPSSDELKTNRKVFITHGKNKKIVHQLKEPLAFGEFEPIVSVERDSVSKPVPTKVLDDMRSCSAAVIHVGIEQRLMDSKGQEQSVLNSNVLIEIGAGMMRYGTNFVLLVEDGTTLPSNLQGLYEVRYAGDELDYPSTMKLLKAFNDFKS